MVYLILFLVLTGCSQANVQQYYSQDSKISVRHVIIIEIPKGAVTINPSATLIKK